jgi:hypothetical protein
MELTLEQLKYPIGKFQRPEQYDPAMKAEWLSTLRALPLWMDACIENLDAHQLQTPYREGGWTVQQVVHHVADSHMNAYVRLKLTLTEENPTVKPYSEAAWATLPDNDLPVNLSVTILHALHRKLVYLLEHLDDADWHRTYHHPEHKRDFALWEVIAMYAWHSRHHMEHIRQLRLRMNW